MMKNTTYAVAAVLTLIIACQPAQQKPIKQEVEEFLTEYNTTYQTLLKEAAEMQWKLNTKIVEGDTVTSKLASEAEEKMAAFTGSSENIQTAMRLLQHQDSLSIVQIRQLKTILYAAGSNPATVKDLVKQKIEAGNKQTELLFGFDYQLDGNSVSTNDLDELLHSSTDLNERLTVWNASKEVGKPLKDGLENLRNLRNQTVQALDYSDYFEYQVSDYQMNSSEMLDLCSNMIGEIWPLYRELHTWARYTLAEKYGQEVPELIPAHWLPNRWGQEWGGIIDVEGLNIDEALKEKSAEWIVKEGENFYMSMGFDPLPQSFYELSSLYPLPEDAGYKKNNHASAWHMDNAEDVRSLMSVVPNTRWWGTTLHELGHIYYYMTYTNPDVPIILRGGANRGFHEAMGSLMGLAAMQQPFLERYELIPAGLELDQEKILLKEALDFVVLIPWGAGVMTYFEHELYANNLPKDKFNQHWWSLKEKYQGIKAPETRGEEYCDACSKTHINNDPAQYYDYAISNVLLFQFHEFIANGILLQDPHATNYYGNENIGVFVKKLMYPGANVDWQEHLEKHLGTGMSANAMKAYFEPLMTYLQKENEGRTYTLPEQI